MIGFVIPDGDVDRLKSILVQHARVAIRGWTGPKMASIADRPVIHSDHWQIAKPMPRFILDGKHVAHAIRRGLELDAMVLVKGALDGRPIKRLWEFQASKGACEICQALDGDLFSYSQDDVEEIAHPNCTCDLILVEEEDE